MAISGAKALALIAFALWQSAAYAQMNHQHAAEAACDETVLRCASKVTPTFGPDGTLWLAWMAGGRISVARSSDAGHSFSAPVEVTKEKLNLDWGPDARPKIVVDRKSALYLKGTTLDYNIKNLMEGGFVFNNPQAVRSCGCGTSFTAK